MIHQYLNPKFTRRLLSVLSIFALLGSASAQSAEHDYYVYYSYAVENHSAGEISFGHTDPPITSFDDNACGVLLKDVDYYAWYFYGESSSPPIKSETIDKDVKIFIPLPGCGGPNPVKITVDSVELLPPGGAADYIVLGDADAFYPINSNGDKIVNICESCIDSALTDYLDEPVPDWKYIGAEISQIKQRLLPETGQAVVIRQIEKARNSLQYLQSRVQTIIAERRRHHLGSTERSAKSFEEKSFRKLASALESVDTCAESQNRGDSENAYISCDKAKGRLVRANRYWDLLTDVLSQVIERAEN